MAWEKIAAAAGGAFLNYLKERASAEKRAQERAELLAAIKKLTDEILVTLRQLDIDTLTGELEGFHETYSTYDPDPTDVNEENRLVRLIDDSARVLGRMGRGLDDDSLKSATKIEYLAIYIPLLYLRAQAMVGREITYKADMINDITSSFDTAIARMNANLRILRRASDGRFGKVTCGPMSDSQDPGVCWYRLGGAKIICGSLKDPRGKMQRRTRPTHGWSFSGV
jgi:hypothetical protein